VANNGFVAGARERGQSPEDAAAVIAAAERGERWAKEVCEEAGLALGRGIVTLLNMFNPDMIVLTGGLSAGRAQFWPTAEAWVRANGIAANVDWVRMEWEGRADPFAIVGAALAAET
jgi:glucokinase